MRALIWLIGIFALAVGVAMVAGVNDGYVLVVLSPWRAQISLNLFIVLLVAAVLLIHLLLRLISRTLSLPTRVANWRDRRRRQKADRSLHAAINALFEGRFAQSLKSASTAYTASEGSSMAALVAARAAHGLQDEARYTEWLGHAAESKGTEVARLMTEAELAIESRQFDLAAKRLATLREGGHKHIAMLRLESRVALALGRWDELVHIVRQLRKHKALTEEQAAPKLRRAHIERMKQLAADPAALATYWTEIPAEELQDRGLVERALPLMARAGHGVMVRRQVERLLDERWDSALARLYAYCAESEADARTCLQKAEGWLEAHPQDGGLLFALGQLCRRSELWGKAQSYLEASLKLAPAVDTHLALAHLFDTLQRPADAQRHYRAAAEKVAGAAA
ncbi:heme biosynthesis HemY N-terminal domain-containing protein [Thauera sp. WH-1]|uniref:heme biosynthesis HemY N-terminal domain-containing protein n=1 Tax=Thauera sp. WH-1 TaxID=3398230 RepID=UPI0039FCD253